MFAVCEAYSVSVSVLKQCCLQRLVSTVHHKSSMIIFLLFQVEEDTSQSMKMLLDIDAIKSKMKAASDALQVNEKGKAAIRAGLGGGGGRGAASDASHINGRESSNHS